MTPMLRTGTDHQVRRISAHRTEYIVMPKSESGDLSPCNREAKHCFPLGSPHRGVFFFFHKLFPHMPLPFVGSNIQTGTWSPSNCSTCVALVLSLEMRRKTAHTHTHTRTHARTRKNARLATFCRADFFASFDDIFYRSPNSKSGSLLFSSSCLHSC